MDAQSLLVSLLLFGWLSNVVLDVQRPEASTGRASYLPNKPIKAYFKEGLGWPAYNAQIAGAHVAGTGCDCSILNAAYGQ